MPSQSAPPRHRTKPWVRRRRMLLLFVALFLLLPMAFLLTTSHYSEKRYEAQLAAIRAAGFPVTVEELQKWTPAAPAVSATDTQEPPTTLADAPKEGENDAVALYLEAFEEIKRNEDDPGLPDISKLLESLDKNETLSDAELAELRRFLAANENALKLLLAAAIMPADRFPLDYSKGYEMELPHLAKLRASARLLRAAAYAAALDGDPDLAFSALMAGISLGAPLRREPILISQLVKYASNRIMFAALGDTLGRAEFSDAQLARLQTAFAAGHDPMSLRNAFVSERVMGVAAYSDISKALNSGGLLNRDVFPEFVSVLVSAAGTVGWFYGDRTQYLAAMDELIQASTLPYPESSPIMNNVAERIGEPSLIPRISQILVPSLARASEALARDEVQMLQASTACAVERYRLANGTPPDTLTALVPAYLPSVPVDPFDNQPMRYHREGAAYTLYSVNVDGVDGGGVAGENARVGDLVFRRRP